MKSDLPFVSVCTPTYNRRSFMKKLINMFDNQDYSKNMLEWIIIDDGEDKIKDLVIDHPLVKYISVNEKLSIGKKRNFMNECCQGDIIVYMDDDDFYPPTRISHAVYKLLKYPNILCAGCSKLDVYFTFDKSVYTFGPYNDNHATANTFAFKKELLQYTNFENDAIVGEEKYFLKNYTIPMIQLNTKKTILAVSHNSNTFDKRQIIKYGKKNNEYLKDKNQISFQS